MGETSVLIVGGGPVGLSMAIALARQGVESVLVERRATTTDHPKARAINLRSMELFRQWGVEPAVHAGALPQDWWRFIWCRTLVGEEIARVDTGGDQSTEHSPTERRIVSQDVVERALFDHARTLPAITLAFSTELTGFAETEDEVVADVVDRTTGEPRTCRARYLVAADGATSGIRRQLGIEMVGPTLADQTSIYFRADLTRWTAHRPADIYYCVDADWIAVVNGTTTWLLIGDRDDSADPVDRIRRSVGVADLPVEVINASNWEMGAKVAGRFRHGRVFLAGDAAHVMSPTGGFGMNTGIQDTHNLAWKLAAVLHGWAGPGLLDTYDSERRPVAESNAAWTAVNASRIWDIIGLVTSDDRSGVVDRVREQLDHISSEGRALGFRYESSAVVPDGAATRESSTQVYRPTAGPGCRAPHAWLDEDGTTSTLDLFDRDLVLLTRPPGDEWRRAVESLATKARTTLVTIEAPDWAERYGVDEDGAVLVRPDGHVAWRTEVMPPDPTAALGDALRRVLALA